MGETVMERRAASVFGWNGPFYGGEVAAPLGWEVTVGWHATTRTYSVVVWDLGLVDAEDPVPAFAAGLEQDDRLDTVADLLAACRLWRVGPFGVHGAVDWERHPGLFDALASVGRPESAPRGRFGRRRPR